MVVVGEERVAELAGISRAAEPAGKDRGVLEGLECHLGERVVGDVWAGVGAGHAEIDQQLGRPAWRSTRCRGQRTLTEVPCTAIASAGSAWSIWASSRAATVQPTT